MSIHLPKIHQPNPEFTKLNDAILALNEELITEIVDREPERLEPEWATGQAHLKIEWTTGHQKQRRILTPLQVACMMYAESRKTISNNDDNLARQLSDNDAARLIEHTNQLHVTLAKLERIIALFAEREQNLNRWTFWSSPTLFSPLSQCVAHERLVRILLQAGANPNYPCTSYPGPFAPLHEACIQAFRFDDSSVRRHQAELVAIDKKRLEQFNAAMHLLLQAGAEHDFYTAMFLCDLPVVRAFFQKEHSKDAEGFSKALTLLIDPLINSVHPYIEMPFDAAALLGLLLEYGANPIQLAPLNGYSHLHHATLKGLSGIKLTQILLEAGVNQELRESNHGKTPLQLLRAWNREISIPFFNEFERLLKKTLQRKPKLDEAKPIATKVLKNARAIMSFLKPPAKPINVREASLVSRFNKLKTKMPPDYLEFARTFGSGIITVGSAEFILWNPFTPNYDKLYKQWRSADKTIRDDCEKAMAIYPEPRGVLPFANVFGQYGSRLGSIVDGPPETWKVVEFDLEMDTPVIEYHLGFSDFMHQWLSGQLKIDWAKESNKIYDPVSDVSFMPQSE